MSVAVMAVAAAFETPASAISAAPVRTASSSAVPSATAGPLKPRTGIAPDARGVARRKRLKVLARLIAPGARSACFAGKQNFFFLGGWRFDGFRGCGALRLGFLRFHFNLIAESRDVLRVFVRRVGFCFSHRQRSAGDFLDGGFFLLFLVILRRFVALAAVLFFVSFFLFEYGAAAGLRIALDIVADFVLLRVDEARRENVGFLLAQLGFDAVRVQNVIADVVVFALGDVLEALGCVRRRSRAGLRVACGFGSGSGFREQPTGQAAARAPRRGGSCRQRSSRPRLLILNFRLDFAGVALRYGFTVSGSWSAAVLRQRLPGQQNGFFSFRRACTCGRLLRIASAFGPAILKVARTAIFVPARVALAALPLRRGVLRRRQVPAAALVTSATAASPAAATSTISTATAVAAAEILAAIATAISATATVAARRVAGLGVVLRGVVARSEILRRGLVGLRLPLVFERLRFVCRQPFFARRHTGCRGLLGLRSRSGLLLSRRGVRASQIFSGKQFDRLRGAAVAVSLLPAMAVIVVFKILEDVADVQKGVPIEADIDERRLHPGKDPRHSAFVDASDQRELFFALDVDFDQLTFFQNCDAPLMGGRGNNQLF